MSETRNTLGSLYERWNCILVYPRKYIYPPKTLLRFYVLSFVKTAIRQLQERIVKAMGYGLCGYVRKLMIHLMLIPLTTSKTQPIPEKIAKIALGVSLALPTYLVVTFNWVVYSKKNE